jgi:DNA repair photolyase
MYPIHVDEVHILRRVHDDPLAERRLQRMLVALKPTTIHDIDDAELERVVARSGGTGGHEYRTGSYQRQGTPAIIFNTFRHDDHDLAVARKAHPALDTCMLLGQGAITTRAGYYQHGPDWCQCQSAKEFHSIYGCLHACDYCHVENFLNVMLDLEWLAATVERTIAATPGQQLYKYDNQTDQICFEPEYGASELFVNLFARQPDKYLLLYTKSDNVDHLLGLDHRGHTIVNWSLSPATQSTAIEKGTPPVEQRIDAMQRCQGAGYPVRCRFSPMIPLTGWQEEYATMIDELFDHATPDVITLDIVGFMSPSQMKAALDTSLFDPRAKALLDEQEKRHVQKWGKHVFPHSYRKEIYEHVIRKIQHRQPGQLIAICNETFDMWEALAPVLGANSDPGQFTCCCGPNSVPSNQE